VHDRPGHGRGLHERVQRVGRDEDVAAAIPNAIRDATGADVRSLPISREEMLRALREAEAKQKEKRGAPAAV